MAGKGLRYWQFEERCRSQWRFAHDNEVSEFLSDMVRTAEQHVLYLGPDDKLWRARLGCDEENSPALDEEGTTVAIAKAFDATKMMPNMAFAGEGRVSPRGILTLYATMDEATAVAEVRPHVGAAVTVAELQLHRRLRIVDCHGLHAARTSLFEHQRDSSAANWKQLNLAFAQPLYDLARTDHYAPTQIVAEQFRRAGFDGVAFHSSLSPGMNVAIFDPSSALAVAAQVFIVREMMVKYALEPQQQSWQSKP